MQVSPLPDGRTYQAGAPALSCRFPGTQGDVRRTLERLQDFLTERGGGEGCRCDLIIVLGEVLNNIVEHAYQDSGVGMIDLRAEVLPDGVHIETADTGRAMPGADLPAGELPDLGVETTDLPEGGFGWFMIRSLTRDLEYGRTGDTNRLKFRIPSQSDGTVQ